MNGGTVRAAVSINSGKGGGYRPQGFKLVFYLCTSDVVYAILARTMFSNFGK